MTIFEKNMHFIEVKNNTLTFSQTTIPEPSQSQCLVKVKAIGINRADLLQRAGLYPPPAGESEILGIEVAGEIIADNTGQFQIGDRVCSIVAGGGYAQYAVIETDHLIKLPDSYSFEQGAALAETYLTAYQALFTISQLNQKEKLLIHAGASGVGSAAIQLAKARGCFVAVTVSSEEKAKACIELGADVAINYKSSSFVDWAKQADIAFDVILDVVAGNYVNQNLKVAALDSRIVILAILGGRYAEQLDVARMLQKRISLTASTLRSRTDQYKAALVSQFVSDFSDELYLQNGAIKPVIDKCYSWQDVEQAHQRMSNNANIGKLVLTVDELG
ncbi:NAD(P)H-quinone oxidoreductase [Thalassotalea montiporae]